MGDGVGQVVGHEGYGRSLLVMVVRLDVVQEEADIVPSLLGDLFGEATRMLLIDQYKLHTSKPPRLMFVQSWNKGLTSSSWYPPPAE